MQVQNRKVNASTKIKENYEQMKTSKIVKDEMRVQNRKIK